MQPIPTDYVPGHVGTVHTVVTNATFDEHIEEIVMKLNQVQEDIYFEKSHVIEDVLLNPGPADDNIDNIVREVLNVQDITCSGEDMTEVDDVPVHEGNIREKVHNTCKRIKDLRNDQ